MANPHKRSTPPAPLTPVDWDSVTMTLTINKAPKQVLDTSKDPVQAYKDHVNETTGDIRWEQVDADGNVIGNAWFAPGETPDGDGWRKEQIPDGAPVYPKRDSHGDLSNAFFTEVTAEGDVIPRSPTQPYLEAFSADVVRARAAADATYAKKYGAVIAAIRDLAEYDYNFTD